jgi:hypothetical protein
VLDLGDGHLVMFYEGGVDTPGVGRADSADDGASWQKDPDNPVLAGAAEPSVARSEAGWLLAFTRPGQDGVCVASAGDGRAWAEMDRPIVTPRPALPEAFDAAGVSDPFLLVTRTAAGRVHLGLFFEGRSAGDDVAIGYAGSYDGSHWDRFGGADPVLAPGTPDEHGPTVLLGAARGYMFFHQEAQRRQRIAVALHP